MIGLVTILVVGAGTVLATPSPNGPGQPGAPATTCGDSFPVTPGQSAAATGSPFNPIGRSGSVYAGNPDTASLAHAGSAHAVSQYDAACFQNSV